VKNIWQRWNECCPFSSGIVVSKKEERTYFHDEHIGSYTYVM
jgi:hypothetical protein